MAHGPAAPPRPPPLVSHASSVHDPSLRAAFDAVDTSCSGALSKRELYAALQHLGLHYQTSEQLVIWNLFDADHNGQVEWPEFRMFGAALLDEAAKAPSKAPGRDTRGGAAGGRASSVHGGFARLRRSQEEKLSRTTARLQGLARKRSLERIREMSAAARAALGRRK